MHARVRELLSLTWEEVQTLDRRRAVVVLPVGAVEAHGPHLPLGTDVVIAEAMARAGAERIAAAGRDVLLLPSLAYTAAPFAAGFPGTLPVRPETVTALVADIARALAEQGFALLAVANAHLDPTHLGALDAAVAEVRAGGRIRIAFPNLVRRALASRLTEEFRGGACHAGQFETSIVLAARPELVREDARAGLPPVPRSLADAIREGKRTFEEAGGARAYFGDPVAASEEEGWETIEVLGRILEEAVAAELEAERGKGAS